MSLNKSEREKSRRRRRKGGRLTKHGLRTYLGDNPGGWGKKIDINDRKYEVTLLDRFHVLDRHMKRELEPALKGTGVKVELGTPSHDRLKVDGKKIHKWASGLDYSDSFDEEATIIEFWYSKPIDELQKMETKNGKNLWDEIVKATEYAIDMTFGRRLGGKDVYGRQLYSGPHVEWESDWEDTNQYNWGLMNNPWKEMW